MNELTFYIRAVGLAGCLVLALACLWAALLYRGRLGERYSPLNHFISELGEAGVSRGSRIFNVGLMAGGLLLGFFLAGAGLSIGSTWSKLGALAGVWASLSCVLVGIFSMDNFWPHVRAALSYFYSGMVAAFLFNIAIWFQPAEKVARVVAIPGALALLAYTAFLALVAVKHRQGRLEELDPSDLSERPKVWTMPAVEWAVLLFTLVWCVCLGNGLK